MKSVVVFFTLVLLSKAACKNSPYLINDFLLMQRSPTKINVILCWSKADLVELVKIIFANNFQVSVLDFKAELSVQFIPEHHQLFLIDFNCPDWEAVLKKAEELNLFRHPYRWLALNGNNLEPLLGFRIMTDSQFFIINDTMLFSTYKVKDDSKFLSNHIATWRKSTGFEYFNELIIPRNRSDLMGITLNISTVMTNPNSLNHIWDYKDRHVDTISKVNYIFCHHLTDMLNVTGRFIIQSSWGVKNVTTGEFTGMVGNLQRGEADLGGVISYVTRERVDVLDYLSSTVPTAVMFIFRAPPLSYVKNILTLPFEPLVWASLFSLAMVTALVLYIIILWEWGSSNYFENVGRLRANFFDVLMVQIGGICQQGSDTEPKSLSGRIALIFSFITLMFLYTSFSANIVSLLQTSSNSIQTLEDLLRSNIKLGVDDTPYNRHLFAVESEPVRKSIYEEKIAPKDQPPNFMSVEEGVARVEREFFAFNVELGAAYNMIADTFLEHEKCGIKEIDYLRQAEAWLPARKHSPFKEIMKVALRKIHERGIQHREVSRFFPKKPSCSGKGGVFVSVKLGDCYYGFLVFGVGVICALIILTFERLLGKYMEKIQKTKGFKSRPAF